MTKKIQLIAEGDGDVLALPEIVRRILHANEIYDVQIAKPTHKRGDILKVKSRFTDYLSAAAIENYPVLCVLDYDCKHCNDVIAEESNFATLASNVRPDHPFRACFIVKEYESLFLWDAQAAKSVLPQIRFDYVFPADPEQIRDAKGELSAAQASGWAYKPTVHQAALSKKIDLDILRTKSPSFVRLEKAVLDLAAQCK